MAATARRPQGLSLVEVGNITESFFVPAYQRGYRWGPDEVKTLLDDVHVMNADKDYCLQPIVVKPRDDGQYELIDGQQRLTTLYLIYRFLEQERFKRDSPPFSIRYATRPTSEEYLNAIDPKRASENIDFFHLHRAYETIREWFASHEKHRQQRVADVVYGNLSDRVKVIWYEVEAEVDATVLFTRLNIGRIPLTNAELVKALLLGKTRNAGSAAPRQAEIATQWDAIERELHDRRFWYFLTDDPPSQYATRIDLLFRLMVERATPQDTFHTFHAFRRRLEAGESTEEVWNDVVERRDLLRDWYEDRDLFHWIGFLVHTGSADELRRLLRESEGKTKGAFEADIRQAIVRRLGVTADQLRELSYDDSEKPTRALLLFNIETLRRIRDSFDRYPFHAHKDPAKRWSLEHIHAQHSEDLVRKEQWQSWLREHRKALVELPLPPESEAERSAVLGAIDETFDDVSNETFIPLAARVRAVFGDLDATDDLHGIENLALLSSDDNAALNNAVFEVKRRRILAMDRAGGYIPICTRRVFLKYYTDTADQQLHLWSKQDRAAYFTAIEEMLEPYLTPAPTTPASGAG